MENDVNSESPTNKAEPPSLSFTTSKEEGSDGISADDAETKHTPETLPSTSTPPPQEKVKEEKQCRICLGGEEDVGELGRLIKPCLCRGSIKYVHVKCINQWRVASQSRSAFWACPQCGFRYAFVRTRVLGLATSPIILGFFTVFLLLLLAFFSSFIVTYFLPPGRMSTSGYYEDGWFSYYSASNIAGDLVRYAVNTFADLDLLELFNGGDAPIIPDARTGTRSGAFKSTVRGRRPRVRPKSTTSPTLLARFLQRLLLGFAFLGSLSFVQLLLSWSLLAPVHFAGGRWLRRRRNERADAFTLLIIAMVAIGIARTLYGLYGVTRRLAQYLLARAETAILEVDQDMETEAQRQTLMEKARQAVFEQLGRAAVAVQPVHRWVRRHMWW